MNANKNLINHLNKHTKHTRLTALPGNLFNSSITNKNNKDGESPKLNSLELPKEQQRRH